MKKRGLSAIVSAVIMIVLVLVAVGVVWSVVSNLVQKSSQQISTSSACLDTNIRATKTVCTGDNNEICNVTITRSAGGSSIGGVKLIFSGASREETYVEDVSGDMTPLQTKTIKDISTGLVNPNKVDVTVYMIDDSENEQLCSQSTSFEF